MIAKQSHDEEAQQRRRQQQLIADHTERDSKDNGEENRRDSIPAGIGLATDCAPRVEAVKSSHQKLVPRHKQDVDIAKTKDAIGQRSEVRQREDHRGHHKEHRFAPSPFL